MKNQYFGDINDFKKYTLLRKVAEVSGQRIGICWMLTPDDQSTHGNKLEYLNKDKEFSPVDSFLFRKLTHINSNTPRNVALAGRWQLIPGAKYFDALMSDSCDRTDFFRAAMDALRPCDIMFFDPDNGFEIKSVMKGKRNSSKYIFYDELKDFLSDGRTVIVYQHFPREKRTLYIDRMKSEIRSRLLVRSLISIRTSSVVFFVLSLRNIRWMNRTFAKVIASPFIRQRPVYTLC